MLFLVALFCLRVSCLTIIHVDSRDICGGALFIAKYLGAQHLSAALNNRIQMDFNFFYEILLVKNKRTAYGRPSHQVGGNRKKLFQLWNSNFLLRCRNSTWLFFKHVIRGYYYKKKNQLTLIASASEEIVAEGKVLSSHMLIDQ